MAVSHGASDFEAAQHKKNFMAVSRVFYDNAATVLREVCKRERDKCGLPLPTRQQCSPEDEKRLEDIDFSALVEHLTDSKRITDGQCGFFFEFVFECDTELVSDSAASESNYIVLRPRNVDQMSCNSPVLAVGDNVWIQSCSKTKWFCIRRIEASRYFLDFQEKIIGPVSVYRPTDAWLAVDALRTMRECVIGNPSSTHISNSALEGLFADVEAAYKKLGVPNEVYKKELDKIKTDASSANGTSLEEMIMQILRESDSPLTIRTIRIKIDRTAGEVSQVLQFLKRNSVVERIENDNERPSFQLISKDTNISLRQSFAEYVARDGELLTEILSVLTVDNPLTIPELAEKIQWPRPDINRVLHAAKRDGKVDKIAPADDGKKPLWQLKASTFDSTCLSKSTSATGQAHFSGKPLFVLEAENEDQMTFRRLHQEEIVQAASKLATPTNSAHVAKLAFSESKEKSSEISTDEVQFELSKQEKENVKALLRSNCKAYSSEEVMRDIGVASRDFVMVYLKNLVEEGLARKKEVPTGITTYEWIMTS